MKCRTFSQNPRTGGKATILGKTKGTRWWFIGPGSNCFTCLWIRICMVTLTTLSIHIIINMAEFCYNVSYRSKERKHDSELGLPPSLNIIISTFSRGTSTKLLNLTGWRETHIIFHEQVAVTQWNSFLFNKPSLLRNYVLCNCQIIQNRKKVLIKLIF